MSERVKLPTECKSVRLKIQLPGLEGYIHVGLYEDGRPGEVFLTVQKAGSTLRGVCDAWAIAISIALQHGVPLQKLVDVFQYQSFEPSGETGDPSVPHATSVIDYVVRWMSVRFLGHQPYMAPGEMQAAMEETP